MLRFYRPSREDLLETQKLLLVVLYQMPIEIKEKFWSRWYLDPKELPTFLRVLNGRTAKIGLDSLVEEDSAKKNRRAELENYQTYKKNFYLRYTITEDGISRLQAIQAMAAQEGKTLAGIVQTIEPPKDVEVKQATLALLAELQKQEIHVPEDFFNDLFPHKAFLPESARGINHQVIKQAFNQIILIGAADTVPYAQQDTNKGLCYSITPLGRYLLKQESLMKG